jgi:hypothetical protein
MKRRTLAAGLAVLVWAPLPAAAQTAPADTISSDDPPSTALPERTGMYRPYRPGERLVYETSVGFLGRVGQGSMEVGPLDTIRGTPALNLRFQLSASAMFGTLTVEDLLQSWLDPVRMRALRFKKDQKEINYETHRVYEFFPDERRWSRSDGSTEEGPLASETPLDDVSFIYFIRSLPLRVGDRYVLNDYFKEDGNPVVIEVLRRETVRVPAGEFQTVVVKPTIKTDGLFGEGGEAVFYFTVDSLHLLVLMQSRMPVLRSLELRLTSFDLGY